MNDEARIKELISRYIDGEATPEEKKIVEQYLRDSKTYYTYYSELKNLSVVLDKYPVEDTSPDWENKIQESLLGGARKGYKMRKTSPLFKVSVGGGVLATLLILCLFTIQHYAQRGIQGRLREGSAQIGQAQAPAEIKQARPPVILNQLPLKDKSLATQFQYEPYTSSSQGAPYNIATGMVLREKAEADYLMPHDYYIPKQEAWRYNIDFHTEEYDRIYENQFLQVKENPLSTFSIDVDTASYSNIRRFLQNNQMPPEDAVRIEEMINYFTYDYSKPREGEPFSIAIEGTVCPWKTNHNLVLIGLQGKIYESEQIPPSNLVFLIDVSGSMNQANKLPLLKSAFKMLVNQLTKEERVAIVVYAGAAGKVLDSTPGDNKQTINSAIDQLKAGGSTAGGAGIKLAYEIAKNNFIENGNNRVILATDGDFNVGVSSDAELVRLIEEKQKEGIFLTVLGFGTGNYKDSKMEQLADKGNGNYYYIDTEREAKKVLVEELGSTLFTIAKDVKIQVEFNPSQVKAFRLIGYENRILAKEDFHDDTKDAGELGAGHTVTVLYEIVPADSREEFRKVDDLVYQKIETVPSDEVMTVKLRYKLPDEDTSKLITQALKIGDIAPEPKGNIQFAAAVAEFGLLLRNSESKADSSYQHVIEAAQKAIGEDTFGYRAELIELVKRAKQLDTRPEPTETPGINFKGQED